MPEPPRRSSPAGRTGRVRVVCLHGLGGTPSVMRHVAAALHRAGHEVACPLLPGHGTRPEDLLTAGWDEWLAAASAAVGENGTGAKSPVVVGQSLGGALALALAAASRVSRVVCVNPVTYSDPDALDALEWQRSRGVEWIDVGPTVLRDPTEHDDAYERLPVHALIEMTRGVGTIDIDAIRVPVLLATSAHDEVVDPHHSEWLADRLGPAVTRLRLTGSGHVATLDADRELLAAAIAEFVAACDARR